MQVSNESDGTVTWNQGSGNNPDPATDQSGSLTSGANSGSFDPSGSAPWVVTFTNNVKTATSPDIKESQRSATVTLNADWTVTVS